jgi:hypothetical protein
MNVGRSVVPVAGESAGEVVPVQSGMNQTYRLWDVGLLRTIAIVCALAALSAQSVSLAQPPAPSPAEARRINASRANLKAIWGGMSHYCEKHGRYPARAILDATGKPLLSWRVSLLPFLGQEELYKQFKLNEPWGSPTNKRLVLRMPAVFRSPDDTSRQPLTSYLVPVGNGTAFGGKIGIRRADITDPPHITIMIVVADEDRRVLWTQPEDLAYDAKQPTRGLAVSAHRFLVMMADGMVVPIGEDLDLRFLQSFFTYAGGDNNYHVK